jgi:hypothetical protein
VAVERIKRYLRVPEEPARVDTLNVEWCFVVPTGCLRSPETNLQYLDVGNLVCAVCQTAYMR